LLIILLAPGVHDRILLRDNGLHILKHSFLLLIKSLTNLLEELLDLEGVIVCLVAKLVKITRDFLILLSQVVL
jgi:hypothetical protein